MSSIVIAGDTSGSVTLQAPAVSGSTVLNLPTTSGTIQTSGAGYTTNGVAYATSTSALSTGSALTFDGTTLGVANGVTGGTALSLTGTYAGSGTVAFINFQRVGGAVAGTLGYDDASTAIRFGTTTNHSTIFLQNNSEAMRLTSTGLGIGTSSPSTRLTVSGGRIRAEANSEQYGLHLKYNAAGSGFYIGSPSDATLGFYDPNGAERARIDSSGNLLVGKTSASSTTVGAELQPTASAGYIAAFTSDAQRAVIANRLTSDGELYSMRRSGTVVGTISVTTSATAYNTSSDYRLKENIQPMQNALGVVAQLNPVTYNWKADGSASQGFIAHELQAVVPDCVTGEKDAIDADGNPVYQGIDTSFLVATLTAALQEAHELIKSLETRISVLENK